MSQFIDDSHEEPKTASKYTRLKDGDNTLRILTSPIMGWEYWKGEGDNKKVVRVKTEEEIPPEVKRAKDLKEKEKRFWMMVVLNKDNGLVQIYEATQSAIREGVLKLSKNKQWGDPREYDIVINKTGSAKDTRYSVLPTPKEKLSKEVQTMIDEELVTIDLERVFEGESPFVTKE